MESPPSKSGQVVAAVQASMVKRGLVPQEDTSSLTHQLLQTVHDLRLACRVCYAFKMNDDRIAAWKSNAMASTLKSVHVSPEVEAKFGAVYDDAVAQMRQMLQETYDRTVIEMSHRIDAFEQTLTRQASESQVSLVESVEQKYLEERLGLDAIVKEMQEENAHQRSHIVFLETRLRQLEETTDRGDAVLCNKLRQKIADLEVTLESCRQRCASYEADQASAKRTIHRLESDAMLLRAKFDMTKGMYARETSQLCDIIRMNEAQFMQVQLAKQSSPRKPTTPRTLDVYEPHSGRTIAYTATSPTSPTKAPLGTQFIAQPTCVSPVITKSPIVKRPKSPFSQQQGPLPTGSIRRPYI
ncbi:hypothetical protein AC1031_015195 [Aphanomyces cochlioides]|nr:hypothetical protein AC1031_015195 [Aphanomyces cochlioides]